MLFGGLYSNCYQHIIWINDMFFYAYFKALIFYPRDRKNEVMYLKIDRL